MNGILVNIEEKIEALFEKKSNKNKRFSILEIARIVDPKNKLNYLDFETVLKKMELEGVLYHDESDKWSLFPYEKGLVQGRVIKNGKGSCFVNLLNGKKYIIDEKDAGLLLDGDEVIIEPTDKTSGSRIVSNLHKIVQRKNGLVLVEFTRTIHGYNLKPISTTLGYPLCLPESIVENLENYDYLFVKIDDINYAGVLVAEYVAKVEYEAVEVDESLLDDDEEEVLEEDEYERRTSEVKKKTSPIIRKPKSDNYAVESYLANAANMKKEREFEDYYVTGVLKINIYGEGTVEANGCVYCIKQENLGDALNGDIVSIRPSKLRSHGKIVSVVEDIIKRDSGLVAVEVSYNKKGEIELNPVNHNLKHKLVLPKDFDKPLVAGDRLLVKIDEKLEDGCYVIEFIRSLGHKDDPDSDIRLIAAEFDIEEPFTEEQMAEANAMPTEVLEEEKVGRLDYTKKRVFTIDGARAKDRDDALSIEKLDNGNYLVGVHIADVTHYIKPGMALWLAILYRATSVYMADTVIPQLPHILSNGILSLNPGVDRLTLSCMIEMTPDGEVVNYDFKDVVIKSQMAMVYDDVNKVLEENIIPEGYEEFTKDLWNLQHLSEKLTKQRMDRGAVDFDDIQNDVEIEYDSNGKSKEFVSKKQRTAEKLIENFMLLAGFLYAQYMLVPTTLRVHESPDEDAIEEAYDKLEKLGVRVTSVHDLLNGNCLTKVIQSIKDQDVREVAANILLRSMKRARIDVEPDIGHFALALPNIGRFTSPMRRAEDAIGHWQLRKQRDGLYNQEHFEEEIIADYDWIKEESEYITKKQYNAEQAEQAAIQLRMAQFIDEHIGETFAAKVSFINESGIFIRTVNGVIGKIDPNDYLDDYLIYDYNTLTYRGRTSGVIIGIGTELDVIALDTHREFRTINFGVSYQNSKKLALKKGA